MPPDSNYDSDEYYSDGNDGPEVADKLDRSGKNLPARLNISINYTPTWKFYEGLRELIQNWRDGMLEIPGRILSIMDIVIEFHEHKSRSGSHFEFIAYDNSANANRQMIGKVSFQCNTSKGGEKKCTIEIINRFITLDKVHLSMGDSSKNFKREFAGGHGEGMKVGINALLREHYSVDFFTNHHKWRWNHLRGRELRVNFSKPKGKRDSARISSGDLHVIVKGAEVDPTLFDRFLFLRVPTCEEQIRPADPFEANTLGAVLVAEKYLHKLFVAGLYVQDHKGENGLHYGYDIPKFKLTRDREATNTYRLGESICKLWNTLLPTSPEAQRLFLKLFENAPSCLDISEAKHNISLDTARILLRQLKELNPGCWLYDAFDMDSETTELIIRSCLKLESMRLPSALWDLFHETHHLIKSAKQERIDRFKSAPPTSRIACPSDFASHTIHLLRIFLALDEVTRDIQIFFVSADGEANLEYVYEGTGVSKRCLVNDSLLRPAAIDHPACTEFHSLSKEKDAEDEDFIPEDYTCSCAAIRVAHLIYEEALAKTSPNARHRFNFFRQNLAHWIPACVSTEGVWSEASGDLQSMKISWPPAFSSKSIVCTVLIEEMPSEILKREEKVHMMENNVETVDAKQPTTKPDAESAEHSEDVSNAVTIDYHRVVINGIKRSIEANSIRVVETLETSENHVYFLGFKSGHKYRVQIQAVQELPLLDTTLKVPPSRPFIVYGLLRPPKGLSVRWDNPELLSVTWNSSEGVTGYEVIFIGQEDSSESYKVVDAQLGWSGLPSLDQLKLVKVRSFGIRGLKSERFSEAIIPERLTPPRLIHIEWQNSRVLLVSWAPAPHAKEYVIRFICPHDTYSVQTCETSWAGNLTEPAAILVSIRSVASNGIESDYSDSKYIPVRPESIPVVRRTYSNRTDGRTHNRRTMPESEDKSDEGRETTAVEQEPDEAPPVDRASPRTANNVSNDPVHVAPRSPSAERPDVDEQIEERARSMTPIPFSPGGPSSDSSDDGDASDAESDLDFVYDKNVTDEDFDRDNPLIDAIGASISFLKEQKDKNTFLKESDFEEIKKTTFSGLQLRFGEVFEFKYQPMEPTNVKQISIFGKILEIRKLKPSGEVVLLVSRWVHFSQYLTWPTPTERWKEDAEDALVLVVEDESVMATISDACLIRETDIESCRPAKYKSIVFKNSFDPTESPVESFVCRFAISGASGLTVLPLASRLSGEHFRGPFEGTSNLSLDVADLYCGAGGLSLGFNQAGFGLKYGVDRDATTSNSFSCNFKGVKVYAQPVEDFIQDYNGNFIVRNLIPSVVLVSPSWRDLISSEEMEPRNNRSTNSAREVVSSLRPPFLVYVFGAGSDRKESQQIFSDIQVKLLQTGYSFSYRFMECKRFGVAIDRKYLILIAARSDFKLPDWPEPSITEGGERGYISVREVISDLNFENTRAGRKEGSTSDVLGGTFCKAASGDGALELSDAARMLRDCENEGAPPDAGGDREPGGGYWVYNHVTGRRKAAGAHWKAVDPDLPMPVVRSTPSSGWACKHWERGDLLTVRELARIMSFPDSFRFFGSLESQYRQVANATPPALAKAIAGKIMQRLQEREVRVAGMVKKEEALSPRLEALDEKLVEDLFEILQPAPQPTPQPAQSAGKRRFESDGAVDAQDASASENHDHARAIRRRLD